MTRITEYITGVALWFVILIYIVIPLSPILIVLLILRKSEQVIWRNLYGWEAVKTSDMVWLDDLPKNRAIVNCVIVLNGRVPLDDLKSILKNRLVRATTEDGQLRYPNATNTVKSGYFNYFWVKDTSFLIDNHVDVINVGSDINDIEDLQISLGGVVSSNFRRGDIPPWEVLVVRCVLSGREKTVLIWRSHHCLADGSSLVYFLTSVIPDQQASTPTKRFAHKNVVLSSKLHLEISQRRLLTLKGMILFPLQVVKMTFLTNTDTSVLHAPDVSGNKLVVWSSKIDFNKIRKLRKKLNVSINDILMSALSLTFHDYFVSEDMYLPDNVLVSFPVDTRDHQNSCGVFTNEFAVQQLSLPTKSGDFQQLLVETEKRINCIKFSGEPFACRNLILIAGGLMPELVRRPMFDMFCKKTSAVVTSVQSTDKKLSIGGAEIDHVTFWSPQRANIGLSFSFFTYNDTLVFSAEADNRVTCNVQKIVKQFEQTLNKILEMDFGKQ